MRLHLSKLTVTTRSCLKYHSCSIKHTTLISRDHVLNVNECIIATMLLKQLKRLHNQVAQVLALALAVVDCVALVQVLRLEEVHDGQDLAVVGHQSLADRVTRLHERLQNVQSRGDNLMVSRVQRSYIKNS